MTTPFKNAVDLIQDGQPDNAATINKPIGQLAQNTLSLKERLDAIEAAQLLRYDDVTLQSAMPVGTPVFIASDGIARPGVANIADDVIGGLASPNSFLAGVLLEKQTDQLGAVALTGRIVRITQSQWATVIDTGVATPGLYFLSSVDTGKLSLDPGALGLYVGQLLPDFSFVLGGPAPTYGTHEHYEFDLIPTPAGTTVDPTVGADQVITVADPSQRGWLPASAPYFSAGIIPVGAKFGYNLQHAGEADLRRAFPPIPVGGVTFDQGGALLDSDRVLVTQFGIWWMDNSYGNAPWPTDFIAHGGAETIRFWFSRLTFATAKGLVQSLAKHPQSKLDIKVLSPSNVPANGGQLLLRVDDVLPNVGDDDEGALALKQVVDGGAHTRGPVTTRVFPGAGVLIQSTAGDDQDGHYGRLVISAANSEALQGNAELVDLRNAVEEDLDGLQVVSLKPNRASGPIFNFDLSRLAPAASGLALKLWLTANLSGTLAVGTTVEYRIIPASTTSAALPTGWTLLQTLAGTAVTVGQSRELTLATIPNVPAGAHVLVRINRLNADGFGGTVSVIRLGYLLVL